MGACAQIAVFTFAYAANALLCLYSVAAWAQEIGTSFSVPFFRLSVGTDDRSKLLCALLLPQRGHRGQEQASLCPSSASAWAQGTGASFSVPFFPLSVGTGDRRKLLCALLLPQRGHRRQDQASLCPSSASAWAQETGSSFSVPLNQGMGRYTQNLIITPRMPKTTGAYLTKFDDYAPHNE